MNDEETLLRAVLEQPDDPATRAVFADWLEEQGQGGGIISFSSPGGSGASHVYTIVYGSTLVAIATVLRRVHRVATPVWRCGPLAGFSKKPTDRVLERWESFAAERCQTIDSWAKVKALALAAPDCGIPFNEESAYRHTLWDRTTNLEARWDYPSDTHAPTQTALIAAYHSMIALAALLPTQIERLEPVSSLFRPLA
jgi:uncharacterized protein (TIGR02996 family)